MIKQTYNHHPGEEAKHYQLSKKYPGAVSQYLPAPNPSKIIPHYDF